MSADQHLQCHLDHLVVCASHLDKGVAWFESLSGVHLPAGGSHPLMSTRNHLTALSKNAFLEIIAIDPEAAPATRPRWFNLDDRHFQNQLQRSPRFTTWVLGTRDLQAALAAVKQAGIDAGEPVLQSRGDLQWHIGLRPDGTLACDGVFPILIQWPAGVNPVSRMQDQGLRLNSLSLEHPQADRILAALRLLGAERLVNLQTGDAALYAAMSSGDRHFQLHHHPSN